MSTKTPPLSQLPSDCGNYVDGEIAEVTNPRPSSTEQKIMIAGSFDSDKIQMIRELMEEEATNFCQDVLNNIEINWVNLVEYKEVNAKELYKIYKQSK